MTKATRRATKTDTLIQNARGELDIRGLNRHRIIPRVVQAPSSGANTPPSGQGSGSTGNFLQPQGDTMIGAIAFFPKVATIDKTTDPANPSIDIGNATEDYSTYVLTGTATPETLAQILGASFSGQLLYLQMTAPGDTTIVNGNATNSGNILTGTGVDEIFNFGDVITLIFDVTAGTGNVLIQGAWRIMTGSSGGGGGATQLNDLTDVTLLTPTIDQVLTFDGSFWVNQDPVSGNLTTNLSNMTAPTIPPVNLSMNGFNIDGVSQIDLTGAGVIQGVTQLTFFQTSQVINSISLGLLYQVDNLQEHQFLIGGTQVARFDEPATGVFELNMNRKRINNADSLTFDPNGADEQFIDSFSLGGTKSPNVGGGIINWRQDANLVFNEQGTTRAALRKFLTIGYTFDDIVGLNLADSQTQPFQTGQILRDGLDIFAFTTNGVKNFADIGAGGAGNSISQGNSNVTVTDTGVGAVTITVDGASIASFTVGVGVAFDKNLNMAANQIISSGNITPSGDSLRDIGGSTLFWNDGFFDQIFFENTNNKIFGDSGGLTYDVTSADTHDFSIAGALRLRVSNTVINIFSVGLDLGGGDISNVDDILMQGSGSVLNMSGGDINGVDDLSMLGGTSSFINMNGGNILNVNDITILDDITIGGDLNHDGTRCGFFGEPPNIRRVVQNPASTGNNDLFIALNDLINALGTINGFGLGLIDTLN